MTMDAKRAPKVSFDKGGAFIDETRREVEQYLAHGSTRAKGLLILWAKAPLAGALTFGSWAILMLVRPGPIIGFLCLGGLVLGALLTAFCVQHDANHGAYFSKRGYNHLLGWTADALLGFSSYAWRVKHNVAHHTYTNVDGFDDDADAGPVRPVRAVPAAASPGTGFQHLYIWPMYTLMGLRLQTLGDCGASSAARSGRQRPAPAAGWNLVGHRGRQG